MTTEQKIFRRQIFLVLIPIGAVAVWSLISSQFTIKSNNQEILEINQKMTTKMSYDAHNLITKNIYDYTEVTRQMLEAHKLDDAVKMEQLIAEIHEIQRRIDRIFETYGIGGVRGDEFEIDYPVFNTEL